MTPFGITSSGDTVHALTLSAHGMTATFLTYGAILQDLRLDSLDHSLTLGSERIEDYEGPIKYHGAIVGPVANRLSGAKAVIDGIEHRFEPNLNGQHNLHSGSAGSHQKIWQVADVSPSQLTLTHSMPYGEGGFPANRVMTAAYEIVSGPTLRLTLTTTADEPSIANATNHSYWNLDGSDHMRDHQIRIAADHYLPTDGDTIPTGEVADVDDTAFDFQDWRRLVPDAPALDTTFCVARHRRAMTECLWLKGANGVTMTVASTEPAMHIYDGRAAPRPNAPVYEGIAIEAQGWPDAPNTPTFPSIEVTPDAPVVQVTEWRFSRA